MWWGRDIIEQVRTASPTQEIASHSFSHVFYDERTTRPDTVRIDIEKSRQAHHSFGLPFQAFVFPNNKVGYKTLLADAGILTYRSPSPKWFDRVPSGALWSLFNFMHFVLAVPPAPGAATVDETGMVNIPASMLLLARHGLRRIVSSRNLVKMGVGGLDRAVEQAAIFHLWFHLSNFTYMTEAQLAVLEAILRHAQRLREAGSLEVLTMTDIQRRVVSIALRNDAGAATQPSEGRR